MALSLHAQSAEIMREDLYQAKQIQFGFTWRRGPCAVLRLCGELRGLSSLFNQAAYVLQRAHVTFDAPNVRLGMRGKLVQANEGTVKDYHESTAIIEACSHSLLPNLVLLCPPLHSPYNPPPPT